jgi:hypothetical protein
MMTVSGSLIPMGLFIFAWTSDPSIHWSGMVIGCSIPMGMGMYMVFAQCFTYLMDVYAPIATTSPWRPTRLCGVHLVPGFHSSRRPCMTPWASTGPRARWVASALL